MISENTLIQAKEIAAQFSDKGLRLSAVQETPLAALVESSMRNVIAVESMGLSGKEGIPTFEDLLIETTNTPDAVGANQHSEFLDDSVELATKALTYTVNLAKTVVNPMIERVASGIEEALDASEKTAVNPININSYFDSPLWSLPYIQELFDRFSELSDMKAAYTGPAITLTPALLETGLPGIDSVTVTHLKALEDAGLLSDYWNTTFGSGSFDTATAFTGDPRKVAEVGLLTYLAANNIEDVPPEGADMSIESWRNMIRAVKNQAARAVALSRGFISRSRARQDMIFSFPLSGAPGSVIEVDGVVYNKFLEQGGSPEILMGAYYTDRNRNFDELIRRKDEYVKGWGIRQAALASANESRRLTVVIGALERLVAVEITRLDEAHIAYAQPAYHSQLAHFLTHVNNKDLQDLWMLARKCICRVVFPHTNVETMLLAVDEAMRQRPDLSVREAAFYASIDIMAKWLSDMIVVESSRL